MPPKGSRKRALSQKDPRDQPAKKTVRESDDSDAGVEAHEAADSAHDSAVSAPGIDHVTTGSGQDSDAEFAPEDYVCMSPMQWDAEFEDSKSVDSESEAASHLEEELITAHDQLQKKKKKPDESMFMKPAAEHPEWKWVMMQQSLLVANDYSRRAGFCNPDNFGMAIYNDWWAYGLNELIENLLVEFDTEYRKKQSDLKKMWGSMAGMFHWLRCQKGEWIYDDDGEGTEKRVQLVGYAFLSLLNEVDRQGQLKPDSEIRDLALVMATAYLWCQYQSQVLSMFGDTSWYETILAYAKKASIDFNAVPFDGVAEQFEGFDDAEPLKGIAKPDRWGWKAKFKAFEAGNGKSAGGKGPPKIGGHHYDITKMTRAERARYAFDKKDPLQHIPLKDLKEGTIAFG